VVKVPNKYRPQRYIPIADADHHIVCDVVVRPGAQEFAEELVKRFNGKPRWWHKLFGPPRDARQRAYDTWIAERAKCQM